MSNKRRKVVAETDEDEDEDLSFCESEEEDEDDDEAVVVVDAAPSRKRVRKVNPLKAVIGRIRGAYKNKLNELIDIILDAVSAELVHKESEIINLINAGKVEANDEDFIVPLFTLTSGPLFDLLKSLLNDSHIDFIDLLNEKLSDKTDESTSLTFTYTDGLIECHLHVSFMA